MSDHSEIIQQLRHTIRVATSHNPQTQKIGIGFIIQANDLRRKTDGSIKDQFGEVHENIKIPNRWFAIIRALEIARENNWRYLRIRIDGQERKVLKKSLKNESSPKSNAILETIFELASHFDEVKFAHIERRKNHMARKAAREVIGNKTRRQRRQMDDDDNWDWSLSGYEEDEYQFSESDSEAPISNDQNDIPF